MDLDHLRQKFCLHCTYLFSISPERKFIQIYGLLAKKWGTVRPPHLNFLQHFVNQISLTFCLKYLVPFPKWTSPPPPTAPALAKPMAKVWYINAVNVLCVCWLGCLELNFSLPTHNINKYINSILNLSQDISVWSKYESINITTFCSSKINAYNGIRKHLIYFQFKQKF